MLDKFDPVSVFLGIVLTVVFGQCASTFGEKAAQHYIDRVLLQHPTKLEPPEEP